MCSSYAYEGFMQERKSSLDTLYRKVQKYLYINKWAPRESNRTCAREILWASEGDLNKSSVESFNPKWTFQGVVVCYD